MMQEAQPPPESPQSPAPQPAPVIIPVWLIKLLPWEFLFCSGWLMDVIHVNGILDPAFGDWVKLNLACILVSSWLYAVQSQTAEPGHQERKLRTTIRRMLAFSIIQLILMLVVIPLLIVMVLFAACGGALRN